MTTVTQNITSRVESFESQYPALAATLYLLVTIIGVAALVILL